MRRPVFAACPPRARRPSSPDNIGLHRVENPSHTTPALSLHLYTPPYSECRTFNEASGQARASGRMTFYTVRGERVSDAS